MSKRINLGPPKFQTVSEYINAWNTPNNFFRLHFYKRYYGVIPVALWVLMDCCWMAFTSTAGFIRTDVVLSRNGIKSKQQGELYDLIIHPRNRKFLTYFKDQFDVNPNLYNAYMEMEKEKHERERNPPRKSKAGTGGKGGAGGNGGGREC